MSIQPTPPNLLSASKEAVLESQAQALRENVGSLEEPVAVWKQRRSDETQREGGRGLLGWSFLDPVASCLSRGALRSSLPHTPTSPPPPKDSPGLRLRRLRPAFLLENQQRQPPRLRVLESPIPGRANQILPAPALCRTGPTLNV